MKKTYVLDTNVLLSDPDCIGAFEDNDLIIPLAVIEELDRHKSRQDEVGKNARSINRTLDALRSRGSLFTGVKLNTGGTLKVVTVPHAVFDKMPAELMSETQVKVDNLIIAFMIHCRDAVPPESRPILVSKDINVRLKCDSLGMVCQDYLRMRVTKNEQEFYHGVRVVEVEKSLIDKLYVDGTIPKTDVTLAVGAAPNEIVILKAMEGTTTIASVMTRSISEKGILKRIENYDKVFTLVPKNKEQRFSLDLLMDPSVKLVTLVGPSGTGKTLLALAAGLEQLKSLGANGVYDKMLVTRSVQPVGKDIGFLPGTMQEKMDPWLAPVKDNLDFLLSSSKQLNKRRRRNNNNEEMFGNEPYLSLMQEKGLIEVEAITYIRGRSIPRAYIVIDEVQNLSMHEIKTIITRAGEGTKIILTGDIEQIDNVHVDVYTNGLTYAVEKFKDQPIAGHVTLRKGERSELATIASQIL